MTKRFRQKSVIIHAMQWKGNSAQIDDFREFTGAHTILCINDRLILKTLQNEMKAYPGDYIVKWPNEECVVCRQNIFEELYEPIKKQKDTGGVAEDPEQNTESEKPQEPESTEETKTKPVRRRVKK